MVFSSPIFLFLFLPVVLIGYFGIGTRWRNLYLLAASLFFYAWGEVYYVFIMLLSISLNYVFGLCIEKYNNDYALRNFLLRLGIFSNFILLFYFKYANFFIGNINIFLSFLSIENIALDPVHLPLGISFFTFQAMSFLVDVSRKQAVVRKSFVNTALYITLFPQLIAGPIVRYRDIAAQLVERVVTLELFSSGVQRFVFGLAKKLLIANPLGEVADAIFAVPAESLTIGFSWLGILCYSFQIYFDFSAYSDMAIGLGRMFGFQFLENFNYPYISQSIQEFWRRWHISLSSWFRDYVYIPLGGNRTGGWQTYLNLSIVFVLCGFWHGASWNFLIWGMLHGVYLIVERLGLSVFLEKLWQPARHAYVLILVMVGWVFFRAEDLSSALSYLSVMLGVAGGEGAKVEMLYLHLNANVLFSLLVAGVFSTPVWPTLVNRVDTGMHNVPFAPIWKSVVLVSYYVLLCLLFFLSASYLAASAYNPFIYFRF